MDSFDKIQQLHRLFRNHRFPISISKIADKLECTNKTAKSAIFLMRDVLNAPLEYDESVKGWRYGKDAEAFELPGLWLTADELHSLAAIFNILNTMDEGLLGKEINVVHKQVERLLNARGVDINAFTDSFKYVSTNKRAISNRCFPVVVDALINKKQLHIHYTDYSTNNTQRTISPQTLIHYQENWYLDAWCHKRNALRSFMLPRITKVIKDKTKSKAITKTELKEHYETSYGIFAGKPKNIAVLRFYPSITKEVASLQWHPEQQSEWQGELYQLSIPYNDDRELIRDILKYGSDIEVLEPVVLKNKIKRIAQCMVQRYAE